MQKGWRSGRREDLSTHEPAWKREERGTRATERVNPDTDTLRLGAIGCYGDSRSLPWVYGKRGHSPDSRDAATRFSAGRVRLAGGKLARTVE